MGIGPLPDQRAAASGHRPGDRATRVRDLELEQHGQERRDACRPVGISDACLPWAYVVSQGDSTMAKDDACRVDTRFPRGPHRGRRSRRRFPSSSGAGPGGRRFRRNICSAATRIPIRRRVLLSGEHREIALRCSGGGAEAGRVCGRRPGSPSTWTRHSFVLPAVRRRRDGIRGRRQPSRVAKSRCASRSARSSSSRTTRPSTISMSWWGRTGWLNRCAAPASTHLASFIASRSFASAEENLQYPQDRLRRRGVHLYAAGANRRGVAGSGSGGSDLCR